MRINGERRLNHICENCGVHVYDTWEEINGGRWIRDFHDYSICLRELHRRISILETQLESLSDA